MKANELRIGNLVFVDNTQYWSELKGIYLEVTSISSESVSLSHVNMHPNKYYMRYSQLLEYIQPIPITEELLLKCSLERKAQDTIFDYPTWYLNDSEYMFEADGRFYHNLVNCDYKEVKYLHQFQNIVFALTGEELEVKL
jgi:hypothetical protein